jgi:hypothetical protein
MNGGNCPNKANLSIGYEIGSNSAAGHHIEFPRRCIVILSLLAAWTIIGFIACLSGCDN